MTEMFLTKDGSWTCHHAETGEHYHNLHGAWKEACDIYVAHSWLEKRLTDNGEIILLDPYFGLGYNTLALMHAFEDLKDQFPNSRLRVIAFEFDPHIIEAIPQVLEKNDPNNLKRFLGLLEHNTYYQTLIDFSDQLEDLNKGSASRIDFKLFIGDTRQLIQQLPSDLVDVIYHDAFSARKQSELWTVQLFEQYKRVLKPGIGCCITYSAAAPVRAAMIDAGFHVYAIPSIFENKPGTLGAMSETNTYDTFSDFERELIASKSGIPYQDNELLNLETATIVANRQLLQDTTGRPTPSSVHKKYATAVRTGVTNITH